MVNNYLEFQIFAKTQSVSLQLGINLIFNNE